MLISLYFSQNIAPGVSRMKIAYVEPFCSGSHRQWIEGYARTSRHSVRVFGLPAYNWKWRMQMGAIELAKNVQESGWSPDLILASDMLDCALFLSLIRNSFPEIPLAVYFHENQLTYPWSSKDRNLRLNMRYFGFKNYTSSLVANRVFFNSDFHRESFLRALSQLSQEAPDFRECIHREIIEDKCAVLPVGIDLQRLDEAKCLGAQLFPEVRDPILLWNHRWDFDKNPESFFELCADLTRDGLNFKLIVCGEQLDVENKIFAQARKDFSEQILHWGYVQDPQDYAALLWRADLVPVTSKQDFFGISIAEAIYCGCVPLLPKRLAYPEVFNVSCFSDFFYRGSGEFRRKVHESLSLEPLAGLKEWVRRYDWQNLVDCYDNQFEGVTRRHLDTEKFQLIGATL